MTAEVSVMNKGAVAMAADSAITVVGRKVYNSGSKLFPLSRNHSVGLMVYGNAALMGVPWETIIAEYRTTVLKEKFRTVKEIGEHFLKFLSSSDRLFPADLQKRHLIGVCQWKLSLIVEAINQKAREEIQRTGSINDESVAAIVESEIKGAVKEWEDAPLLPDGTPEKFKALLEAVRIDLQQVVERIFQKLPRSPEAEESLIRLAPNIALKRWLFIAQKSGIVFCGFGTEEIYPSQFSLEIELVNSGIVKFDEPNIVNISDQMSATIHPFAQQDVAMSFLQGADPTFRQIADDHFKELFSNFGTLLLQRIELEPDKKVELERVVNDLGAQSLEIIRANLQRVSRERFVDPVLNAVQVLPKDELATMAETLVSLTSFRRKMSLEVESVGGPIDVAVISKKDGFIWIKRKHYFSPELNRDFFERKNEG